jgi:hypothetical protein
MSRQELWKIGARGECQQAAAVGFSPGHLGSRPGTEDHHTARARPSSRFDGDAPGSRSHLAQEQHVHTIARLGDPAQEPGGKDARIVEDHKITGVQIVREIGEAPMGERTLRAFEDEEPSVLAVGYRLLRNQFGRNPIVEVAQPQRASFDRLRSRCLGKLRVQRYRRRRKLRMSETKRLRTMHVAKGKWISKFP